MSSRTAKRRVEAGLKHCFPHSVKNSYKAENKVKIYSERERERTGTQCVARVGSKITSDISENGTFHQLHKQQAKPYIRNLKDLF